MINKIIFGRIFSFELRTGIGFDIEFVDSKLVWTYNQFTEEHTPMQFEGTVILIPFFTISYGQLVQDES